MTPRLIICDVDGTLRGLCINSVADEVEPCHAESLLIDGVVIKGILICDMSHAENGEVFRHGSKVPERQDILPWRDDELLAEGEIEIQRSAEIKVIGLIGCSGTHRNLLTESGGSNRSSLRSCGGVARDAAVSFIVCPSTLLLWQERYTQTRNEGTRNLRLAAS